MIKPVLGSSYRQLHPEFVRCFISLPTLVSCAGTAERATGAGDAGENSRGGWQVMISCRAIRWW